MTLRFAPTDPADPVAAELLTAYFADRSHTWQGTDRPYRPARADAAQLTPPNGVLLVVWRDAEPIGVGGVRRIPSETGTWFEVKHLFATPAARGLGVGAGLLAELERRAVAMGATDLVLDTNRSLAAAGRLYERAGFVAVAPFNDNPNATDWFGKRLG